MLIDGKEFGSSPYTSRNGDEPELGHLAGNTKVLIVDDWSFFGDLLKLALSNVPMLEVLGIAHDTETAIGLTKAVRPDTVLINVELPWDVDRIEVLLKIKQENPQMGLVVISCHNDPRYAGLPFDVTDASALAHILHESVRGMVMMDPAVITSLGDPQNSALARLIRRQRDVLELVAQGYSAASPEQSTLTQGTIETHVSTMYQRRDLALGHPLPALTRTCMPRIFISYRREDSAGHTGRLYDWLEGRFGKDDIFMDVDTIEPGLDFVEAIQQAVGSCDALIAVIGKRWLDASDAAGHRRLDDPEDLVRLEIATALERGIRVLPVLVEGAREPRSLDLPDGLKLLGRCSALELSDTRFRSDVYRLIEALEAPSPNPGIDKRLTAQELTLHAEQWGAQVLWGRYYEDSVRGLTAARPGPSGPALGNGSQSGHAPTRE